MLTLVLSVPLDCFLRSTIFESILKIIKLCYSNRKAIRSSFTRFQSEDFIYIVIPLGGSISSHSTVLFQIVCNLEEENLIGIPFSLSLPFPLCYPTLSLFPKTIWRQSYR